MKKMFGLLAMFLLLGMLSGVAMASIDSGPPGVAVLMFSMGDALGDVSVNSDAKKSEWPDDPDDAYSAICIFKKGSSLSPSILVGCNHKTHPSAGHLGGVSLAHGNTMAPATAYLDMKLIIPDQA